jgi:L-amino acid N-acyltransferase YncA
MHHSIIVRDATAEDMPSVQRIYAHYVSHGLATFEETPPSTDDLIGRRAAVLSSGLPYLVAEEVRADANAGDDANASHGVEPSGGASAGVNAAPDGGRRIVGYAYATFYRPRPAYRHTIENSVYVEDGLGGRGIGRALLTALIARCDDGPWRQMIAVIGNSGNAASIALHASLGFQPVGTLHAVGFKLGRWVDTVLMQRPLGPGSATPP